MKPLELSLILESFRVLENSIIFPGSDMPLPRSLLLTSADPQEGKSTIVSILALTLAHAGKRVLLIDTDLRRPMLHEIFKVSNETGLSDYLSGDSGDVQLKTIMKDSLSLLPSGSKTLDPSRLVNSEETKHLFNKLLEKTKDQFDFVLFDSPPVLVALDTALLASLVDSVIFVLNSGKVTKNKARKAKTVLEKANASVIGTILNNYNEEFSRTAYHPYGAVY